MSFVDNIKFRAGSAVEQFKIDHPEAAGFIKAHRVGLALAGLLTLASVVALSYFGATGQLSHAFNQHVLPGLKTGWHTVSKTFIHKVGPWAKGAANTVAESMSKNTPAWITAASAAGSLAAGGAGGYFIARKVYALSAAPEAPKVEKDDLT